MADSSIFSFDDGGGGDASSDNFSPEPKPLKSKPAPKKAVPTATAKAKAAPRKMTQTTLKSSKPAAPKKRAKPQSDAENSDGPDSLNDDSLLSNTPPSAKRQKKAPGPKKSSGKPLQPIRNESHGPDDMNVAEEKPTQKPASGKGEQYQKLTQLEHILKRPDTYIGSVERTEKTMWVYNSQTDSMESREVSYVPGLYKIFDEVLVNAADNKQRDKNMDEVRVNIDREHGFISVRNNGRGIPIEIHSKEGIYVPELIFGHLLTSSNYDDDEQKTTGGRNGYGAKLCNVYSTRFILETADARTKQKYKQTWTDNMTKMGKASITSNKGDDYTTVTFYPDFAKFGMDHIDDDFEAIVKRRVYDMAGTCKEVKVFLNGERIKVRNFKKYMEMYTKAIKAETSMPEQGVQAETQQVILTDNPNERWEIGFAVSDGSFQQVSFVNSIATTSGGTHVNYIADQVVGKLMDIVKKRIKKEGGVALKNNQIRNHIFLFVNCLIVNPAFTSQTKEQLTTKPSQFGSKCTVSDKFLNAIAKTEAVSNILYFAQKKADQVLKKSDGNRRSRMNNSKLTDANKAGTKDGYQCTLILTEGDSASVLALAGRAVVDPDRIGVFPLRGKLLNVRDASVDQIAKNQEIQNIKKFMGLQHKKVYEDTRSLRYGHLMIMTDQDHDGSHIKGLLINFLEVQYPSLLKIPGFLKEFITPIVKVWRGDVKRPKKLQSFFTMPEYEAWKEQPGNGRGWDHKYFKGLGTSSPGDAEIYFRDLDRHLKEFSVIQAHEPQMIDLAFSKKKADARKEWLRQFRPGTYLDMTTNEITYEDFINKELILFSMADNMRSIPSVVDGLKPGQRKVLYTCFRRNLKKDIKVVELAGSVSGLTAYAHGETSLQQTIVGLAQNFVGSNNINCLEPSGNFGSRLQGGNDCASARYIYTRLSPFARKIFHTTDEALLKCNKDDGKDIEPELYVPIVPMILVNGSDGIGTGWSSNIPNFSPEDIVDNLKRRMEGSSKEAMQTMKPWYRGWTGEVEDIGNDRFRFDGKVQQTGDNEVEITELPVGLWTQDFKDRLEDIIKAEKSPSFIKDYTEYNTPVRVHFIIKMEDKHMKVSIQRGLLDTFRLSKTMSTTNLVAFDPQGRINKYATVLDIMEEFYHHRLKYYEARRKHLLDEMEKELEKMNNQRRFVQMIIDGQLIVYKKKKAVLVDELRAKDFKAFPKVADARKEGEFEAVAEIEDEDPEEAQTNNATGANDFDYLLGMPIWSLTQERIEKLKRQIGDKEEEFKTLSNTPSKRLWLNDLDDFINEWRFQLDDEAKRAKKSASQGRRASAKLRIGGVKKRKVDDSDFDSDFAVSKPKKAAGAANGKAKPSSQFDWMKSNETAPKPKASQSLMSTFAKPKSDLVLDGTSEHMSEKDTIPAATGAKSMAPPRASQPKQPKRPRAAAKKMVESDEDEDDDDDFAAIANEVRSKPASTAAGRQPRAAARKPVKYANSEDSDASDDLNRNGDDLLGDVTKMVKGIPRAGDSNTVAGQPKSLFTASASRPSSSSSHGFASTCKPTKSGRNESDAEDETDYKSLVPKDSPQKPAARKAREVVVSDEEDDSFDMTTSKAALQTSGPASRAISAKPAGGAAVKPKKAPAAPAEKPTKPKEPVKKLSDLSPAAKAYAKKHQGPDKGKASTAPPAQPKLATAGKKSTKKVVSDDEDEDADALANDIMGDDEDEEIAAPAAVAARPSRRAAAAKPKSKYVFDEDSEDAEDSDEEDGFDDDDDDDSE